MYLVFFSRILCDCSSRLTLSIASFMSFITWNLSNVIDAFGNLFSIPDMNAGDISQQKLSIFLLDPLCCSKSLLNESMVEASFPSHTCTTFDLSRSINTETYLCPFALDVSSTPTDFTFEKSSLDLAYINIVLKNPPYSSIMFVDHLSNRSHSHMLSHQDYQ